MENEVDEFDFIDFKISKFVFIIFLTFMAGIIIGICVSGYYIHESWSVYHNNTIEILKDSCLIWKPKNLSNFVTDKLNNLSPLLR